MSKYDQYRTIHNDVLFSDGPFQVRLVSVVDDAPVDFLKTIGFKHTYYGVYHVETGVLEYETPYIVEARQIVSLGAKALNDAAGWEQVELEMPERVN